MNQRQYDYLKTIHEAAEPDPGRYRSTACWASRRNYTEEMWLLHDGRKARRSEVADNALIAMYLGQVLTPLGVARLERGLPKPQPLSKVERALLAVVEATRAYLPPDGIDAQECLNRILAATDNPVIAPIIAEIEARR